MSPSPCLHHDVCLNLLLAGLPDAEWNRWQHELERVELQLGQVLMNLVINARDAVGGTGRVRLRLSLTDAGDRGTPRARCSWRRTARSWTHTTSALICRSSPDPVTAANPEHCSTDRRRSTFISIWAGAGG